MVDQIEIALVSFLLMPYLSLSVHSDANAVKSHVSQIAAGATKRDLIVVFVGFIFIVIIFVIIIVFVFRRGCRSFVALISGVIVVIIGLWLQQKPVH